MSDEREKLYDAVAGLVVEFDQKLKNLMFEHGVTHVCMNGCSDLAKPAEIKMLFQGKDGTERTYEPEKPKLGPKTYIVTGNSEIH